jgi:hypothetical protein
MIDGATIILLLQMIQGDKIKKICFPLVLSKFLYNEFKLLLSVMLEISKQTISKKNDNQRLTVYIVNMCYTNPPYSLHYFLPGWPS